MKIFISHASANKEYGNALVDLLRGVGIGEEEIIFTSNSAYGIPISKNIFNWLKSQINEKPFVVYLLSKEYYASIACLNEMGAAWIIENEHAILFTPNFDIGGKEFQSGAIDPREMGFRINDEERVLSFIQHLEKYFTLSKNPIIINQKLKKYLLEVNSIAIHAGKETIDNKEINDSISAPYVILPDNTNLLITATENMVNISSKNEQSTQPALYSKFINEVSTGKLKDEELILFQYMIETSKMRLFTGWQEQQEIDHIKEWEEINEINNTLSRNYSSVIRKFELRGYTEVSAYTSSNNPKEVKLKSEISDNLLDFPQSITDAIKVVLTKNRFQQVEEDEDLPF